MNKFDKSIVSELPFLSVTTSDSLFVTYPYNLKCLRDIGFDLFDDIIDNSYDLELDPKVRIDKIISNLIKLKSIIESRLRLL